MTRTIRQRTIWFAACPPALMTLLLSTASGEPAAHSAPIQIGGTPSLVVNGAVDTIQIPVSHAVMPILYFVAPVKDAEAMGNDGKLVGTAVVRQQNVVMMYPRRSLRPGEIPTVRVQARGYDAFFQLREAAPGEKVPPAYRVWHRTEQEALQALIDSRVETKTEERDAKRKAGYDQEVQDEATRRFVKMIREHRNRIPAQDKIKTDGGEVVLGVDVATWLKDDVFLLVPVNNTSHWPFKPKAPHVFDERGTRYEAELVDPGPYGVGGEASDDAATTSEHRALIPGHTETSVVVHIANVGGARFDRLRVVFDQVDGLPSAWAEVEEWPNPFMRPKSAEEVEIGRRNKEALGRVSVHVQGVAGFIWLGDGLDGNALVATELGGLGIRATYGFNRFVMLDAEVVGAASGKASFEGVSLDGMEGELRRTASLGRVVLSGQIRLGYRVVPYVRLGVGFRGVRHDSELMTSDGPRPGPEESFEIDGIWTVGAGIDFPLGSNLVAGGGFSYLQGASSEQRLLELGAHLGYAWNP